MKNKVYIYNYETGKWEAIPRLSKEYLNKMYARYQLARRKSIKSGYNLSEELTKTEYAIAYKSLIEDRRQARQSGKNVSTKDPAKLIAERDEIDTLTRRQAYRIQKKLRALGEKVSIKDIKMKIRTDAFFLGVSETYNSLKKEHSHKEASRIISKMYFDS